MKIKNASPARQGINTENGLVWIEPGQTKTDLKLTKKQAERVLRIKGLQVTGSRSETEDLKPEPKKEAPKFEAKHRGGGSWSITDESGKEVVEKLTKFEAEKFNALSDEDKAKAVADFTKPADA